MTKIVFPSLLLTLIISALLSGAAIAAAPPGRQSKDLIREKEVSTLFYQGIIHLYQFEFKSAAKLAEKLIALYPPSPWGHVLSANIIWWKIITGENNATSKRDFYSELDKAEANISSKDTEEGLYCQIIINSLKSRYELMNKNYLASIVLLNKSKTLIHAAEGKETDYEPYFLTQGLFQYFMAVAQEKMGFFSYLLQYKADKKKGLSYLERLTHSEDKVLRTEGNYFLMKIYLEIEKDPARAKPYADRLLAFFPRNLVFCYYNHRVNALVYGIDPEKYANDECRIRSVDTNQLTDYQIKYLSALLGQNN